MSDRFAEVVARLAATIEARKGADPASSYTAQLLNEPVKAAKKLGEEALEAAIAAVADQGSLAAESADLIYHWLVVLSASGVTLDEVAAKLEAREGTSGITEKASRG
ncbi:phosphoribosyl-ATP diphosphatase [Phenylobacterium sp. J367]|uniref:phosphoribosyl-ATP diphosphatase n=1 Tax=Phenylobacterium sp. J367 TaxID=2898435 RepID=UPI002151D796|nr:phosphoribosyl-ATP diphosphatase [Phenylobacterium sp. J367]MCR5878116.1 phosphoribosyl-ATP diphosphatase [Phenylobacterium sp. J367]